MKETILLLDHFWVNLLIIHLYWQFDNVKVYIKRIIVKAILRLILIWIEVNDFNRSESIASLQSCFWIDALNVDQPKDRLRVLIEKPESAAVWSCMLIV